MWARGYTFSSTLVLSMLAVSACTSSDSTDSQAPSVPGQAECNVTLDPFKELLIVDEEIVGDARSRNTTSGPWSFRHAIESIVPDGADQSNFVLDWLRSWGRTKDFNGIPLDRFDEPRDQTMEERVICPWLRATPANQCDDGIVCSCAGNKLDLARAPFRLVAVSNRTDLGGKVTALTSAGEGRFVFSLTKGAADDPASAPDAMTVIFEYALSGATPEQWAKDFHTLSSFPDYDEAYKAHLQSLTDRITARGAMPGRPNGSALSQVRTNESALNWIWQMREFSLDMRGSLTQAGTGNTPGQSFNDTPQLSQWILKNRDAILQDNYKLPSVLLAGSIEPLMFVWRAPTIDEPLRRAFSNGTCNGCHIRENTRANTTFLISPFLKGREKVSDALKSSDPTIPGTLAGRANLIRPLLCRN